MKKTLKNNQKCVRMSDFTLCVVEGISGKGFNDKFENLVHTYANEEKDIQRRIETLKADEKRLMKRIETLSAQANRYLPDISRYLNNVACLVKNAPIDGQLEL